MKQLMMLAALAATIIGASAVAGAVRANDMAEKAAENAHSAITTAEEKSTIANLVEVSAEELQVLIDTNKKLVLLDARSADEYKQGHIPGSIALRPNDATETHLAELAPSKDTPMVFYCQNRQCPASAKAAHKAAELGYAKLYKYTAGIDDWREKGMPVVTD